MPGTIKQARELKDGPLGDSLLYHGEFHDVISVVQKLPNGIVYVDLKGVDDGVCYEADDTVEVW